MRSSLSQLWQKVVRRRPAKKAADARLDLERLEERTMLATYDWVGTTADWADSANWLLTGGTDANANGIPDQTDDTANFTDSGGVRNIVLTGTNGVRNINFTNTTGAQYSITAGIGGQFNNLGALNLTGSVDAAVGVNIAVNTQLNLTANSASLTVSGVISSTSDNLSLNKYGNGQAVLQGNNASFLGWIEVSAGMLVAANNNALGTSGSGNASTAVNSGAALGVRGGVTINETLVLNGGGGAYGGSLVNVSGNNTIASTLLMGSNATIKSNQDTLTLGNIEANYGLTFDGAGTTQVNGVISGSVGYVEGLREGRLTGNPSNSPNPGGSYQAGPRLGQSHNLTGTFGAWGDNETWVYTGQIYDEDGIFQFAENVDDNTRIYINNVLVLSNGQWNVPTSYTTSFASGGWFDIEIRFSNGGGGAGAVFGNGFEGGGNPSPTPPPDRGFVYSPIAILGAEATNGANADYVIPLEVMNGTPELFRSQVNNSVTKNGSGTLILNNGGNTYQGVTNVNAGTVQLNQQGNLGSTAGNTIVTGGTLLLNGLAYAGETLIVDGMTAGNAARLQAQGASSWDGPLQGRSGGFINVFSPTVGDPLTLNGPISLNGGTLVGLGAGTINVNGQIVDGTPVAASSLVGTFYSDLGGAPLELLIPTADPSDDPNTLGLDTRPIAHQVIMSTPIDFGAGTETTPGLGDVLDRGSSNGNWAGGVGANFADGAIKMQGTLRVDVAGLYTFTTRSDDGSQIWLDLNGDGIFTNSELVASRNATGAIANYPGGTVQLEVGVYNFRAAFFDNNSGGGWQVQWDPPGTGAGLERQVIPIDQFARTPTNGVMMNGSGTMFLNNETNTYTGLTTVNAGIVAVTDSAASAAQGNLGSAAGGTVVNATGTLQLNNVNYSNGEVLTLTGTVAATAGTLSADGTSTWGGDIHGRTTQYMNLLVTDASDSLTLANTGTVFLNGGTLQGAGAGTITANGQIVNGTATLVNTLGLKVYSGPNLNTQDITFTGTANDRFAPLLLNTTDTLDDPNLLNLQRLPVATYDGQLHTSIDFGSATITDAPFGRGGSNGNIFDVLGINAPVNYVVGVAEGWLRIDVAGNYVFTTRTDDGGAIWLDLDGDGLFNQTNERIASQPNLSGMTNAPSAALALTPGYYRFRAAMYENDGDAGWQVSWNPNGAGNALIPNSQFARDYSENDVVMNGTGTFILNNGGNSYTGQTIGNAGTIEVGTLGALGATSATSETQINAGATLRLNNVAYSTETLNLNGGTLEALTGANNSWSGPVNLLANSFMNVENAGTELLVSAAIADGAGAFGFTKTGDALLVLNNAGNSYDGTTIIEEGTLRADANGVLGTVTGGTTVETGGTLLLNNLNYTNLETLTLAGGTLEAQTGTLNAWNGSIILTGDSFVDVENAATDLTINGAISGAAGEDLTKTGAGDLFLTTNNTFAGDFHIQTGLVQLNAAGQLSGASAIFVGELGGTATLVLNNAGNVSLGSGIISLGVGATSTGTLQVMDGTVTSGSIADAGGTANLFVDGSSVASMTVTGSVSADTVRVGYQDAVVPGNTANGTLTISNGLTASTVWVGFAAAGSPAAAQVVGALTVSGGPVNIGTGSETLLIGRVENVAASTTADGRLDLSGASSVNINAGTGSVLIGTIPAAVNLSGIAARGDLLFSTAGTNVVTAATLLVADSPNSVNNAATASTITFGASNTLNVTNFTLGGRKADATATIAAGGVLNLNGAGGAATTANLLIGDNSAGTSASGTGLLDLSGGTFNANLNTVVIGRHTSGTGSGTGQLIFDAGLVVANSVTLGSTTSGEASGRIDQNGGEFRATTLTRTAGDTTAIYNWNAGTIGNRATTNLTVSNVEINVNGAATHTLDVDAAQTATFQSTALLSGNGSLTKVDAGGAVFQAAETFSGELHVQEGTLTLSGSGNIANVTNIFVGELGFTASLITNHNDAMQLGTGTVTLGVGATSTGTLQVLNGVVSSNSILDGGGTSNVYVDGSAGASLAITGTLTADSIRVGYQDDVLAGVTADATLTVTGTITTASLLVGHSSDTSATDPATVQGTVTAGGLISATTLVVGRTAASSTTTNTGVVGNVTAQNGLTASTVQVGIVGSGTSRATGTVTVTGGAVSIAPGSGSILVGLNEITAAGTNAISNGTLDFRNATSVTMNVGSAGSILLGTSNVSNSGLGGHAASGRLLLSEIGTSTVSALTMYLGNSPLPANAGVSSMTFGLTNNFNVTNLVIGRYKSAATADIMVGGTLNLRGYTVGSNTNFVLGDNGVSGTGTASSGIVDLSNGTFNASLQGFVIGRHSSANAAGAGSGTGIFTMDSGTVTVVALTVGTTGDGNGSNTSDAEGTLNLGGGSLTVNGNAIFGQVNGSVNRPRNAIGTLNQTGGTFTVTGTTTLGNIIGSSISTTSVGTGNLNLDAGTFTTATLLLGNELTASGSTGNITQDGGILRVTTLDVGAGVGTYTATAGTLANRAGTDLTISDFNVDAASAFVINGPLTIDIEATRTGTVTNTEMTGTGSIDKTSAGTLILNSAHTYAGGTTVTGGTLLVTNTAGSNATGSGLVTVRTGALLTGNGQVGSVTVEGAGNFGASDATGAAGTIGTLTVDGNLTILDEGNFFVDITGAPNSNDTINVSGAVDVSGANIGGTSLFAATNGMTYVIINLVDPAEATNGTFDQSPAVLSSRFYDISYAGGSGNDVVLIKIATDRIWTGADAVTNDWSDADNWGGIAPDSGDVLIFGAGAARIATNNNDFVNYNFTQIIFDDTGYVLNGNAITVRVEVVNNGGTNTISLAGVTVAPANPQTWQSNGGTLIVNSPLTLLNDLTLQGPGNTQLGAVTGAFDLNSTAGGTLTLAGTVDVATITTGTTGATQINTASVTTTGSQTYGNDVTLGIGTTLTAPDVNFNGNVTGAGFNLAVTGNGTFGDATTDTASGLGALTVGGNAVFNGSIGATSVAITGTTNIAGGTVNTGAGTQTYTGAVTLLADANLTGTGLTFDNTLGGAFNATLTDAGNTNLNGVVNLGSLTTVAGGTTTINTTAVTTTGVQQFGDAVLLTAGNTTLAAGDDIGFATTLTGAANNLTINSPATTSFGGNVTLASVLTDSQGTADDTQFGNISVTTTGNQSYLDTQALTTGLALNLGGGTVQFGRSLHLGGQTLTVNAAGGSVNLATETDLGGGTLNTAGAGVWVPTGATLDGNGNVLVNGIHALNVAGVITPGNSVGMINVTNTTAGFPNAPVFVLLPSGTLVIEMGASGNDVLNVSRAGGLGLADLRGSIQLIIDLEFGAETFPTPGINYFFVNSTLANNNLDLLANLPTLSVFAHNSNGVLSPFGVTDTFVAFDAAGTTFASANMVLIYRDGEGVALRQLGAIAVVQAVPEQFAPTIVTPTPVQVQTVVDQTALAVPVADESRGQSEDQGNGMAEVEIDEIPTFGYQSPESVDPEKDPKVREVVSRQIVKLKELAAVLRRLEKEPYGIYRVMIRLLDKADNEQVIEIELNAKNREKVLQRLDSMWKILEFNLNQAELPGADSDTNPAAAPANPLPAEPSAAAESVSTEIGLATDAFFSSETATDAAAEAVDSRDALFSSALPMMLLGGLATGQIAQMVTKARSTKATEHQFDHWFSRIAPKAKKK